jgi:hypothetical protein
VDRVDVKLSFGYLILLAVFGVITIGIVPLAVALELRKWPRTFDRTGLVTRGGLRIPWSELSSVTWLQAGFAKKLAINFGATEVTLLPVWVRDKKRVIAFLSEVTNREIHV